MTKPLEALSVDELRDMVRNLEAQLCDLYAQLDDAIVTPEVSR